MSGSTSEIITPMPSPNSKATVPKSIAEKMPVGVAMVSESIPKSSRMSRGEAACASYRTAT